MFVMPSHHNVMNARSATYLYHKIFPIFKGFSQAEDFQKNPHVKVGDLISKNLAKIICP